MPTAVVGDSSALTTTTLTPDTGSDHGVAGDTFFAQFVSEPMAAGNVFAGTVHMTWAIQGLEAHAANNLQVQFFLSVVSEDGNTVRATLMTKSAVGSELATSLTSRTSSPGLTGSYTTVAGDRLVLEISLAGSPGGGGGVQGHNGSLRFGSNGASGDLPDGDDTQTGTALNPWIEIENLDIAFAGGSQTVSPGSASLTLTGAAPTVTATDHKTVQPTAAALTLTGAAPTVRVIETVTVQPDAAALTLTGAAPTVAVTDHQVVQPTAAALALTGAAPTVGITDHQVVQPTAAALALTGAAPTVVATDHKVVQPDAAALTLTGAAPTVRTTATTRVQPDAAALALTGAAPTVAITDHQFVQPDAAALTLTGAAPTVTATDHKVVQPAAAALTLTGAAPTVTVGGAGDPQVVQPDAAALTLTGAAPTVSVTQHVIVTPDAAILILTTYAPTVTGDPAAPSDSPENSALLAPSEMADREFEALAKMYDLQEDLGDLERFVEAVEAEGNVYVDPAASSFDEGDPFRDDF